MAISITLEPMRPEHAAEMFDGLSGKDAYRFLADDPPADVGELAGRYERQARGRSDDGTELWYNWIVRDAGTTAALGYTQATIQGRSALVAYHVFPAYWRSGIGCAAMTETLDRIFCQLDADRAWALVDTRNVASIALLRKLGFKATGHHQGADFFKGETSDEYGFEISQQAWSGRCSTRQQKG
jgi:RimJ/RimL family protein N-acetyltransferase